MSPPDGLLTSGFHKHDVDHNPHIIAPDPFASDDCLDVFSPVSQFLPPEPEELNTMNSSEDEPSSGLNGRLRPRKSSIPSPQSIKQFMRKLDGKHAQEKSKRSSTPSKASPSKPNEPESIPTPQLLCPYCDRIFVSKQSVSKHVRRLHLSNSKHDSSILCLFCNHVEAEPNDIIRHMVDSHPNQYFACLDCHSRFRSTKELAEHKLNVCEKQKIPYRGRLRQNPTKKSQKSLNSSDDKDDYRNGKNYSGHGFNGIVISCELKPSLVHDEADIEDNITTNLILPPSKNLTTATVLEKNAVIVLDDIQWTRRIPSNFSFHNTDADQILSRLGVVHRSPKTGESTKKEWFRAIEDATQKFEKCFDTSFYSKVASNVQENLTKFLDGSFNFNPDPDSTIKTRKSKNSVVINTAEGFPILLACEQYSRNVFDGYMPRTIAPKHKWKWDSVDNEKQWNPDEIKTDSHTNSCIITLVSSLDIWTQLCMRRKFEDKFNITPIAKKTEKQNMINRELKEILESREIPTAKSQIIKSAKESSPTLSDHDFPTSLGLMPSTPKFNIKPAVLSGEWVRPRCYVCCACGAQTRDSRALSMHVASQHPNAQIQYYEIVGDSLLKADILKHLYVPPNQSFNRTRPPRGFRDCTKCNKSVTIEDLHQHMLDCAGDTPAVRRKCRYRPFGVRRRRPRLPDNRIRKKMRNDIRTRPSRQKTRMRPRPKIRTEVGDAETIKKMLADLPAKRHRVLVNPLNSILRPRRKLDKQRALLMMKRRTSEEKNCKARATNSIHLDNNDRNKNREDDDNKPLKPRLKRVKITRQKESLNRKSMLNKPKRKVISLIEKKVHEDKEKELDMSSSPEKIQTEELSLNHNEKRININSDPQNVREHSSDRGGSNNGRRDNQRPGCSGQNGNLRNFYLPPQNIPLKHSIARLTANSETHDKSVQFHHLFLVQQECNNTNEHVPTGQRVLFENEAVVTKLDKPPLHFNQQSILESLQAHGLETFQGHSLDSNECACIDMQAHTSESIQGHSLESIQGHNIDSIQGRILEAVQGHALNSIQGRTSESIQGHNFESIQAQSLESLQGQTMNSMQVRNLEPTQGHALDSLQGHTVEPIQGHVMETIPGHALESIEGHTLEPVPGRVIESIQRHSLDSVQGHTLKSMQGHTSESIQGHNLDAIQAHTLKSIQEHTFEAIQGRTLECIQGHTLESIQDQTLESFQGHTLDSIQEHTLESLQDHNIDSFQGHNYDFIQKNKLNKPRKGLNDCIAMLRNKLVEPDPGMLAHLTVQCGAEIQIDPEPVVPPTAAMRSPKMDVSMRSVHTYHTTNQRAKKPSPKNKDMTEYLPRPQALYRQQHINQGTHRNAPVERKTRQSRSVNYDNIVQRYIDHSTRKEASRRRSVSQADHILLAQQFLHAQTYNHEAFLKLASEAYDAYNLPPQKVTKSRQRNVKQTMSNDLPKNRTIDIQIYTESPKGKLENCERNVNIRTERARKSSDTCEKPTRSRTSRRAQEACEKQVIRVDTFTKAALESSEKHRKKALEIQVQREYKAKMAEERKNANYVAKKQRIINVNPDVNMTHLKQVELQPIMDMNVKMPVTMYTERIYNDDELSIPPAHASTVVGSILSAPLDLSGKALSLETNHSSRQDSMLVANYDNYETLDLSSKSRTNPDSLNNEDEVVDLRVKHNSQYSCSPRLRASSSESSQHDVIMANALSLAHRDIYIPTDLSLKGKQDNFCINLSQRDCRMDTQIQDLSKNKNRDIDNEERLMLDAQDNVLDIEDNRPTDLSHKNIIDIEQSTPILMTAEQNEGELNNPSNDHIEYNQVITEDRPEDLSGKSNDVNNASSIPKILITEARDTLEPHNETLREYINDEDKTIPDTTQLYVSEGSPSQKPVYDPTLRIPQYKFRSSGSESTSEESNATEAIASMVISTCAETYPSNEISVNNTLPCYRQQNTTPVKNPLLASIETQERITYSFTNPALNIAITTVTGTLPVYTLLNRGIPTPFTTYGNTSSVYTLPNTCISVSKIVVSKPTTLTNSLLSIPSTTIASTTPVYTLAGTTIITPLNYGSLPSTAYSIPYPPPGGSYEIDPQAITHFASPRSLNFTQEARTNDDVLIRGGIFNYERDNEITRNVMLPKEIVSILGTMPVDHRNQLLDVLPQYLSATRPIPILSTQTSLFQNAGHPMLSMPMRLSRELAVDASTDTVDMKPLYSSQVMEDPYRLKYNVKIGGSEAGLLVHNQVIDLTYDDIVLKTDNDSDNITDDQVSRTLLVQENPGPTLIATKSNVQKTNNDKTASLRAVRIKAPSERQKSKLVINQLQVLPSVDFHNMPGNDYNDTERSTDADQTVDIQLSEVSSTQQMNRNKIIKCTTIPQAIIPANMEFQSTSVDAMNARSVFKEKNIDGKQNEEPEKIPESKVLPTKNSICNEMKESLEATETTKSTSVDVSANNNVNISSEKPLLVNQIDEEDDSDDNISLAVIVKQKQQNENKLKSISQFDDETNICKNKTIQSSKTNKTNSKTNPIKTLISSDKSKTIVSKETEKHMLSVNTDVAKHNTKNRSLNKVNIVDELNTVNEVKNKSNNKKGKKLRRLTVTLKDFEKNKEKHHKNEHETDINKENDKLFESANNLKMNDKIVKIMSNEKDNLSSDIITDSSCKKVKIQESREVSKNNVLSTKLKDVREELEKGKNKSDTENVLNPDELGKDYNKYSKSSDSLATSNEEIVNENKKSTIEELRSDQNVDINKVDSYNPIQSESTNLEINNVLVTIKSHADIQIGVNQEYDSGIPSFGNTTNVFITTSGEDIGQPLRRSRRGKSLFAEGNEQAISSSDNLLEQKTPLTKKQLIFSKLLLDEENYIKNAGVMENETVSQGNNLCSSIENQTAETIDQEEHPTTEEKNKSFKRKKSPPPKRKFKKKKSLDICQNILNESDEEVAKVIEQSVSTEEHNATFMKSNAKESAESGSKCEKLVTDNITQLEDQSEINSSKNHTVDEDQNQITISNNTEKRKITTSITSLDYIHSSKPKKSKLNNFKDILNNCPQDESGLVKSDQSNGSHNLPPAARRTRSKSVVVKSSSSMLYDPYDIELEDMCEITEPFRKQRLSLLKTGISKSNEDKPKTYIIHEAVTTLVAQTNLATNTEEIGENKSQENISDSDESSKSDVPLKKYVEEKERKSSLSIESSNTRARHDVNNDYDNETDLKQSRKKHKKVKRTTEETDDGQKTQEQLRSEQFMESFGFFSERKPRKSNLLATKKISETFHTANESDDVYFEPKDRKSSKKNSRENRKTVEEDYDDKDYSNSLKLTEKRVKKLDLGTESRYCHVCKKEFRRPDNLVRHQMTLLHVSNLAEFEMRVRTVSVPDEPNYLVVFKQHLDRLRVLQLKMKAKKHKKITLPTMQQILVDVRRTVREQQLARRSLSRDEALFLDCCELLKDSNRSTIGLRNMHRPILSCCSSSYALACASALSSHSQPSTSNVDYSYSAPSTSGLPKKPVIHTSARLSGMADFVPVSSRKSSNTDPYAQPSTSSSVLPYTSNGFVQSSDPENIEENSDDKCDSKSEGDVDSKSDGDVDSITAQNILNSEEVRNLENDLISGLKETCKFQPILSDDKILSENIQDDANLSKTNGNGEENIQVEDIEMEVNKSAENEPNIKTKKRPESKEKKNADIIQSIDIFEDKFDKIKRKCRSQAAAAKQVQTVVEPSISNKTRKRSEKKKGKKSSKKHNQNTVLTKGALKGYDSIKVSILTSDINMSAIVPPIVTPTKKKKKSSSSRKKKDRKNSLSTHKQDSNRTKESSQKNVDVYEFMDNEEPEIFELRPSTVMERFKNINNKDTPSTSKVDQVREELETNDSVSDEDDFVYMSDDYVDCDDETETILKSFEKSASPLKRKDTIEKNAVMGKIFKNNAVRSGKKNKSRDRTPPPPPANLDQLFDSLLEDEPNSSMLVNDPESPKKDDYATQKRRNFSPIELSKYDLNTTKNKYFASKKIRTPSPALSSDSAVSKRIHSFSSRESSPRRLSPSRYDTSTFDYGPSTSNRYGESREYRKYSHDYVHSLPKKYELAKKYDASASKSTLINDDLSLSPKYDVLRYDTHPKMKTNKIRSPTRKKEKVSGSSGRYDYKADCYEQDTLSDDAGVARQRARRKCTVGKQNVLAETWSSESEPDGIPPRPNSAESVVLNVARKKKGRKKEAQTCGGRKSNKQVSIKKQDNECRVTSSNRIFGASGSGAGTSRSGGTGAGPSGVSAYSHTLSLPGPSGIGPRLRPTTSFWADGDEEQEHVQQHGWIVGDSHKKLVTMLAHAKGRKRNNDDKRHMME